MFPLCSNPTLKFTPFGNEAPKCRASLSKVIVLRFALRYAHTVMNHFVPCRSQEVEVCDSWATNSIDRRCRLFQYSNGQHPCFLKTAANASELHLPDMPRHSVPHSHKCPGKSVPRVHCPSQAT